MIYQAILPAETGDADRAGRLEPEVAAFGQRWPRWAARLWDTFNVRLAILEHDAARSAELIDRLEPDAGHWAVLGGGVLVDGPVCAWLGWLEAARQLEALRVMVGQSRSSRHPTRRAALAPRN